MNPRLGTTSLTLRLLISVAVALTLCSYGAGAAQATASAPAAKPRLIVYAGGESPGVQVQTWSDRNKLRGAPKLFKRFIGHWAVALADQSTCDDGYVGVTVERVRTDGFAVGGVNDCGGYAALWAFEGGRWREIQGTQEIWACGMLWRHEVPSSIAGTSCYDYSDHVTREYHHR